MTLESLPPRGKSTVSARAEWAGRTDRTYGFIIATPHTSAVPRGERPEDAQFFQMVSSMTLQNQPCLSTPASGRQISNARDGKAKPPNSVLTIWMLKRGEGGVAAIFTVPFTLELTHACLSENLRSEQPPWLQALSLGLYLPSHRPILEVM